MINIFARRIAIRNERKKNIDNYNVEFEKIDKILSDWPELCKDLEKAKKLRDEKYNRELLDQYEAVKKIKDELATIDTGIADRLCLSDTDIKQVKKTQSDVASLENKLCGMNLSA